MALVVLSDAVFLAEPKGNDVFVATHFPLPRSEVSVGPPPQAFGHTVLRLRLGPTTHLMKVSSEREAAFWASRLAPVMAPAEEDEDEMSEGEEEEEEEMVDELANPQW